MRKEDILHLAAEEMQQDWSDLRFQDVFYKAYIQGALMVNAEAEKLTIERDNALAQNAELVAKTERMQTFIRLSATKWVGVAEVEPTFWNLLRVANETPQQCLRDRDAETGRAGFVAGYEKCWRESYGTKPNTDSVDEYADSYAERVKAGEA